MERIVEDKEQLISGDLEVVLASTAEEIDAAQALRYKVFCGEMGAKPTLEMQKTKRDFDKFDEICDHLLVIDHSKTGLMEQVVGNYRLLRKSRLREGDEFYTSGEFDISNIMNFKDGDVMELGRSCVNSKYRGRMTMQLLWKGIGAYVLKHNVGLMFGCASFNGSDYKEHAKHLAYLAKNHTAPKEILAKALPDLYKPMDEADISDENEVRLFASLPTLVKGYLRLNGYIGQGAVEDKEYNTTDVCIILKTDLISDMHSSRFGSKEK